MRKVIVSTFLSLDGVMQAPGGPEEDPTGGFTLGGWSVNFWDDSMMQRMGEAMTEHFDLPSVARRTRSSRLTGRTSRTIRGPTR